MVHPTAARDRVFIKHAQTGNGFAGVNNASPRALNAIDISSCERSNTTQALKEIERYAFRHQDGTSRTTNICERCAAGHGIGVGDENLEFQSGIDEPDNLLRYGDPRNHDSLLRRVLCG